jgi:adenosine deaminase CECR1
MLKNLITGYDLIAEEDPNYPIINYANVWIKAHEIEKKYNEIRGNPTPKISVPFYFHDRKYDSTMNHNVVDAVMLGAKRIGHGFNIAFFPFIKKQLINRDICLEICPISNQILQYFKDLRVHSANSLFREGVPMVLSTDHPVMFGYSGLTYDFWVATVSWGLDLKAIKRLVYNSIIYSSLSQNEIEESLKYLNISWNMWIDSIYSKIQKHYNTPTYTE